MKFLGAALTALLAFPSVASAHPSSAPAPAPHAAAPVYHAPAPVYRAPAPVYRAPAPMYRAPGQFYRAPAPIYRAPGSAYRTPVSGFREAPPSKVRWKSTAARTGQSGHLSAPQVPYASGPHRLWAGPFLRNPRRWHKWGWNHGIVWFIVPVYWGGGFWGPWDLGYGPAALDGAIVDYGDQQIYGSYEVAPNSPGEQVLADYGLQQTECGPPNLVVIWGPQDSVVCAFPNDQVSAGDYEIDPATLTLRAAARDRR